MPPGHIWRPEGVACKFELYTYCIWGSNTRQEEKGSFVFPDRRIVWNKTARAAVGAASTGGVGRYVMYHLRK